METITLENQTLDGVRLEAIFLPTKGMTLSSYKRGDVEIIDQSTSASFSERSAGLGVLIGPHFHRRRKETVPKVPNEELFPHIARVKAKGIHDPFSHGVARYAPWKVQATKTKIIATLTGKDEWNGVPLSTLEGQNFKMTYIAELTPQGLDIELSIVSDTDSLVGIHYYYALPNGKRRVVARVQNRMIDQMEERPIPAEWHYDEQRRLIVDLDGDFDFTFHPFPNSREGEITLETSLYTLITKYSCVCDENAWQLYHPKGASFVCIEPISAQDPRHPNLSASSLKIALMVQSP